jgi:hypothetical protein
MEYYRDMPRRRFRFRPAAAVVLLSAAACQSRAAWTYADGGTSRVQRIYQGVLARCAAAWLPESIVASNKFYTLGTNTVTVGTNTMLVVTQAVNWAAVTTNAWGGPGVLTSAHLQMLDSLLLAVTTNYVDTFFLNAQTNYNDWFEREAYVPFTGYVATNANLDACSLDDDWRLLYDGYTEGVGYSGERGYHRVRMRDGIGELPAGNTLPPPGDYDIIVAPTNYPMLTPAAVGRRLKIGRVDLMETNGWGQITGGQFRWTKDWRDDHGTNTSAWVLWEAAAARAPYTWSGFSHGFFGTGAGLLIPFWLDPYRDAWLKANSSLGAANLWAADASYMRSLMDGGGPCYISYPRHNPGVSDWPGEYCAVVGRRVISNAVYWCQAIGHFNTPAVTNFGPVAILLVPRGTNAVPPLEEVFYYADMTNRYAPARLLTKTGSETNAFWATVQWSGEYVNNEVYYPGDNLIAPATNEWYWRQWRGDSIPRRYVVTNEFPRYRMLSGAPGAESLPGLSGYSFDAPVAVDPILGQMLVECGESAATNGASAHHWQSVVQSPAWLCSPPTNPAIVRLEYAPAQALYTETQGEPLTRLTDLILSEREAYLDYLVHCVASPGWTWIDTQEAATNAAASFPGPATNEGHNAGANVAERWAASQARMDTLADWIAEATAAQVGAVSGLPAQTVATLTNETAWAAAEAGAAPRARLDIDHSLALHASYRTTWWSAAYDPASMGCSNYLAPWIGYAQPKRSFAYSVSPWPDYGTNTFLTTTNFFFPTFDWSYLGTVAASGPSSHSFEFVRSSSVITAAPPNLDGLEASAACTNHYGREAWAVDSRDWISRAFSRRDNPVHPSVPACLLPSGTNLASALAMQEYDTLSELYGIGDETVLAVNTNMAPPVTNWVPMAYLTLGWEPVLSSSDYYITQARSNEEWRVTVNIASNDTVTLPGGQPRPWIAIGYDFHDDLPVFLWVVTNDYDSLYQRVPKEKIISQQDWDSATNAFFVRAMEPTSFWYQSCTNQPHGSTSEKGADGAINCAHDATRTISMSAVPVYIEATNLVYFTRVIAGTATNWYAAVGGPPPGQQHEVVGDPVVTNIVFHIRDWPGDWVTWRRTGFSERDDYRKMWMGGEGGTGETFKVEASAAWDYLAPLIHWRFRPLASP